MVVSSAVPPDNLEIVEAHRLKIPVIPRAEMLAELMRLKYGIAVAGAHGKTTTTSMIATVLAAAGLDPTFVVGGRVNHAGATARLGHGEYMVVEADESDRTFLLLAPVIAVVTTIDREHLDQYNSLEEIQEIFTQFVNRVPFYGAVVLCLDEPNVQAIIPRVKRPVITYGTSSQADLVISDVKLNGLASDFALTYRGDDLGMFHLPGPPGIHNVRNAAAAAAVALGAERAGGSDSRGPRGVLRGRRRFEIKGVFSRHHADRRLRPSSRGNSRHARSGARLRLRAPAGAFPAAPLLAHAASVGRFLPRVQSGRRCWCSWTSTRRASRRFPASPANAGRSHSRGGPQERGLLEHDAGGIEFMLREARPGDAILTIGAGNVSRVPGELAVLLGARVSTTRHAD